MNNTLKIKKMLKYIIMFIIIYLAIKYISSTKINNYEMLMISAVSSITFAILDIISPSIKMNNI